MTFLPIVERELRVASRRWGTYWLRSGIALAVICVGGWLYLMGIRQSPAEMSMIMFVGLTIVAGLFCLGAGARATADCLSEEKRDGTLGLLFLTDLRGYDVVAGKLVASSLNAFYGLIAVLPVLAIPLLMGGVTPAEFWRVSLVLMNTLLFSLAAGMIASALTKSARNAAGLCVLIVLGIAALPPLLAVILAAARSRIPDELFLIPSPGYAFATAFDSLYRGKADYFWLSVIITHGLTWAFLAAACLIVPRSWQDRPAGTVQIRWRDRWQLWSLGNSAERAVFRARLLDVNPFLWLAARARIKPALVWATLGVLGCGWIWGWVKFQSEWINPATFIVTALLLNTILKGWFAGETCAQLAEDRRIGALELVLSTPLNVQDIMRGQFLALLRQFLWPLVVILAVEMIFMVVGLNDSDIRGDEGEWIFVWVSGWIMLLADLAALFYVSLWQSVTARNANRANSAAMTRILALPWILFGGLMMLIAIASFRGPGPNIEGSALIVFWLFIGLGVDAFFGIRAKMKLESEFREVATTRYTPPPPLWKRLFGSGPGMTRET
jgi:ABC-type transport system involved in cytochrome c biogenesis permease component